MLVMLLLVILAVLLSDTKNDETEHEKVTITGTVSYLQRIALPLDTTIVQVQLLDISKQDIRALVLGQQTITPEHQVPIPFAVSYNPEDIIPNHRYAIQARITDLDGTLRFTTTQVYSVITNGNPRSDVQVILQMVR